MSHAQRTRRRRRGSGGPRNKAFLALMVVGILRRARRAGRRRLRRLDRRLGAAAVLAQAARRPATTRACSPPTGSRSASSRPTSCTCRCARRTSRRSSRTPRSRSRTSASTSTRASTTRASCARRSRTSRRARRSQGGSTITMQLVRSLYISNERTYTRKIREAKLAEELENEHSKEWILEKYLDSIPYGTVGGQSAIGIKAAAKIYFSKDLKRPQPARGGAARRPAAGAVELLADAAARSAAKQRRNEVLRKMAELGMITEEKAEGDERQALGIKLSTYFSKRREEYFFDYVKDQLFREYGAADRARGRDEGLHDDRPRQAGAGARHDRRPPRRHRAVVGDRHDQPAQRLHRGDGVVGRLRRVELQPRRPGPPPAGLDVQGDGADDRAAARRRPGLDALRLESPTIVDDPIYGQVRHQDLRRHAAAAT